MLYADDGGNGGAFALYGQLNRAAHVAQDARLNPRHPPPRGGPQHLAPPAPPLAPHPSAGSAPSAVQPTPSSVTTVAVAADVDLPDAPRHPGDGGVPSAAVEGVLPSDLSLPAYGVAAGRRGDGCCRRMLDGVQVRHMMGRRLDGGWGVFDVKSLLGDRVQGLGLTLKFRAQIGRWMGCWRPPSMCNRFVGIGFRV